MTLIDRLSHLTPRHVEKLLGPRAQKLLIEGGKMNIDITTDVTFSRDVFRLHVEDAYVSIVDDDRAREKMRWFCSTCEGLCEHIGAAFSLILEEKTPLGIAAPPPENNEPVELNESELIRRELLRRSDRAREERLRIKALDERKVWSDYAVTNAESGKTYRVALRGWEPGESYCSCPDFRKNTLGTCKHIMAVVNDVRKKMPRHASVRPFTPDRIAVHLRYGAAVELRVQAPDDISRVSRERLAPFLKGPVQDVEGLTKAISICTAAGDDIVLYPDAEEYITIERHRRRFAKLVAEIRQAPAKHPLLKGLLKSDLLPYQLDGIAFAAGIGRAVLADDMGLGKTIQAIGVAELLARESGVSRVLIVCPASVKSQWRNEIVRFSGREAQIVAGNGRDRAGQYANAVFFTICNYEQVLRDLTAVEKAHWDLIVLDEGQRIKNWFAKTSRTIKALRSPYALVLSGTPLENRLEELYSVVEFIDDRRLGPDFRFEHRHRIVNERGRVMGYKNLDTLRDMLRPVLLRRTRAMVMKQLPPRTTDIVRIPGTDEQIGINATNLNIVAQIVRKAYLTEMDLLRLQKALLLCRMAADSTFLVDKQAPGFSSKLERLAEMLPRLAADAERKVVLFSEWTTMLDLIEKRILNQCGLQFVRLDGSVPQRKRQELVHRFQNDPACTFFIATNAGATGLNLQAANTVVNVDLPWNPAVLEQRIGRAHRMGQKRPVHVYVLVTEGTIEENMLKTLAAKKDLSIAALDLESDVTKIDLQTGIDELKKRLEILLGDAPAAPIDESEKRRVEEETQRLARKTQIENAGGQLLLAAMSFINAVAPQTRAVAPEAVASARKSLESGMDKEPDGTVSFKLRLPNAEVLDGLSRIMATFMGAANPGKGAGT
jgi:superfamily II DNA or RNA helicase/predicted nucleic acid-binding Zn finger protein